MRSWKRMARYARNRGNVLSGETMEQKWAVCNRESRRGSRNDRTHLEARLKGRNGIVRRCFCNLLSRGGHEKSFLTRERRRDRDEKGQRASLLRRAIERKLNRLFSHANAMLPADFVCVTYEMKVHWPATVSWNLADRTDSMLYDLSQFRWPTLFLPPACIHVNAFHLK